MRDLSIVIPARNEEFLLRTIEDILQNIEADTEIIAVLDGYWPDPPIPDNDRVVIMHRTKPIGQRAATNEGVRLSQAKYVMKVDAHCAFDKGFDRKLMEDCQPDWIMIPSMWNLHAFDWECRRCGNRTYQGFMPKKCEKCGADKNTVYADEQDRWVNGEPFVKMIVWKPRGNKITYSWRFDNNLQFQYWKRHHKRPECQGKLIETMSFIGACMFMEREYYWKLGGCDEKHGPWGQFGTEWACKTWLSGGKLISTRKTWFGHMFRTGNFRYNGSSAFPYDISQSTIDKAREYSRDFWFNNKWDKAIHDVHWLVEKFKPVPDWHDDSC